jgi:short-subunit dehydrogenase
MIGILRSDLFTYFGIAIILYKLSTLILAKLIRSTDIADYKYGWFVITGATQGIGKEFARQLSQKGFKIILMARSKERLKATRRELSAYNDSNNIEAISVDFSQGDRDPEIFYKNLADKLHHYEISGLINNVGVMPDFCNFPLNSKQEIENTLSVNIYPITYLTYFLASKMQQRYQQAGQRSIIINMTSISALKPTIGFNIYGSTKSYIMAFSQCISYEYDKAIQVVAAGPTAVKTRLSDYYRLSGSLATAPISTELFVRSVFDQLHKRVTAGYFLDELARYMHDLLPDWAIMKIRLIFLPKDNKKLVDYRIYDEAEDKADKY